MTMNDDNMNANPTANNLQDWLAFWRARSFDHLDKYVRKTSTRTLRHEIVAEIQLDTLLTEVRNLDLSVTVSDSA